MCVDLLARRRTVGILTGARGMVEIDRRGAARDGGSIAPRGAAEWSSGQRRPG
jgi:hypothetical protein